MRLLVLSPDDAGSVGGGSMMAERLASALAPSFVHLQPSAQRGLLAERLTKRSVFRSYMPPGLALRRELVRLIRQYRPTVVHAHGLGHPFIHYGVRRAIQAGIPVVITSHGLPRATDRSPAVRYLLKQYLDSLGSLLDGASAIACPTRETVQELTGLMGREIRLIPWGWTDDAKLQPIGPTDERDNPVPSERGPSLLAIGRLVPLRRFETLIQAARLLRSDWPTLTLTILGPSASGSYHRKLVAEIRKTNLMDVVRLNGEVPHREVGNCLRAADVYVSAASQESFGMANLEAVLSGTPAILSRAGVASELLADAPQQLIPVDARPEQVAAAVRGLLERGVEAKADALRRAEELRPQYAWERTVESYSSLLGACGSRS